MAINEITLSKQNAIKRKSAQALPDNPTNQGMSAEQIKGAFWKFILDNEDSVTVHFTGDILPNIFRYSIEGDELYIEDSFGDRVIYNRCDSLIKIQSP